jgi:CBS domain-containing protein
MVKNGLQTQNAVHNRGAFAQPFLEDIMRVSEAMTPNVQLANPNQSIIDAARMMSDADCGALPVGENDRLVGMVTDRDIVVRALAHGKTDATIRDVMTESIEYCFEDDDLDDVASRMGDLQVRRLPVLNSDKRLVGIVSLGDIATIGANQPASDALSGISEPSQQPGTPLH